GAMVAWGVDRQHTPRGGDAYNQRARFGRCRHGPTSPGRTPGMESCSSACFVSLAGQQLDDRLAVKLQDGEQLVRDRFGASGTAQQRATIFDADAQATSLDDLQQLWGCHFFAPIANSPLMTPVTWRRDNCFALANVHLPPTCRERWQIKPACLSLQGSVRLGGATPFPWVSPLYWRVNGSTS